MQSAQQSEIQTPAVPTKGFQENGTIEKTQPACQSSIDKPLPKYGDKRTRIIACEHHGTQLVEEIYCRSWIEKGCPVCEEEKRKQEQQAKEKKEARRKEELRIKKIQSLIGKSGVPKRFTKKDLSSFNEVCEGATMVKNRASQFVEEWNKNQNLGISYIFCGTTGTGKTHLAAAIANELIKRYQRYSMFMTVGDAVRKVRSSYGRKDRDEQQEIDLFTFPDLLILDEVGVQYGTDSEKNILFDILNKRYLESKSSILISNLTLKEVTNMVGERIIDRFSENGGGAVIFDWQSQRGRANA